MTLATKEDLNAVVAAPWIMRRQLTRAFGRGRVLGRHSCNIAEGSSRHAQQEARAAARDASTTGVGHLLSAGGRAYHFFCRDFLHDLNLEVPLHEQLLEAVVFGLNRPKALQIESLERAETLPPLIHRLFVSPCFLAISATDVVAASRMILTICSSVNMVFRIMLSTAVERHLLTIQLVRKFPGMSRRRAPAVTGLRVLSSFSSFRRSTRC